MPLTPNETQLLIGFIKELEEKFSCDGCNDYDMPDTPENRELFLTSWKLSQGDDVDPDHLQHVCRNGVIHANNGIILYGLRKKLEQA
jgi:hypothetical protein